MKVLRMMVCLCFLVSLVRTSVFAQPAPAQTIGGVTQQQKMIDSDKKLRGRIQQEREAEKQSVA